MHILWTSFALSFLQPCYANKCICKTHAHHIVQIALTKTLVETPQLVQYEMCESVHIFWLAGAAKRATIKKVLLGLFLMKEHTYLTTVAPPGSGSGSRSRRGQWDKAQWESFITCQGRIQENAKGGANCIN